MSINNEHRKAGYAALKMFKEEEEEEEEEEGGGVK
jgi:hypothetical protein